MINVYYATPQMMGTQAREGDVAVVFLDEAQRRISELEQGLKLIIAGKHKSAEQIGQIAKKALNGVL